MSLDFVLKHKQFEGPLDELLRLIERRKLHISDFALAAIADEFIDYNQSQDLNLDNHSSFVVIATALVLIKSKSLLPTIDLSEDEQASIDDLKDKLIAYRKIKNMVPAIENRLTMHEMWLPRRIKKVKREFSPGERLTIHRLRAGAGHVIADLPRFKTTPKARLHKAVSLEETVSKLVDRLKNQLSIQFSKMNKADKADRIMLVVNFLAILELVKQDIVTVSQESSFSDITLETKIIDVPRYN